MRCLIRLDTMTDVNKIVEIATGLEKGVRAALEDGTGFCVSAKSLLGGLCAMNDFKEIYFVCDKDITTTLMREGLLK